MFCTAIKVALMGQLSLTIFESCAIVTATAGVNVYAATDASFPQASFSINLSTKLLTSSLISRTLSTDLPCAGHAKQSISQDWQHWCACPLHANTFE